MQGICLARRPVDSAASGRLARLGRAVVAKKGRGEQAQMGFVVLGRTTHGLQDLSQVAGSVNVQFSKIALEPGLRRSEWEKQIYHKGGRTSIII